MQEVLKKVSKYWKRWTRIWGAAKIRQEMEKKYINNAKVAGNSIRGQKKESNEEKQKKELE